MREAWMWETYVRSQSFSSIRVGSQISPPRAKKDSNISSPGRTRSVICSTPGPTKTIKSPPHALPPSPPPPPSITLIGALAGRSSDTARSRNQSDCRIWRISLARKLGKRQSVATVVLLKTSKKNQEQFPNLMKAFADWTFKSFRPELIFYQTIMFHSLLRN